MVSKKIIFGLSLHLPSLHFRCFGSSFFPTQSISSSILVACYIKRKTVMDVKCHFQSLNENFEVEKRSLQMQVRSFKTKRNMIVQHSLWKSCMCLDVEILHGKIFRHALTQWFEIMYSKHKSDRHLRPWINLFISI